MTSATADELHAAAEQMNSEALPAGWEAVASSRFAVVTYCSTCALYYKEFLPRGPMEAFKARIKGSRATRARRNSDALRQAGFNAPVNVCWGVRSNGNEYLFTQAVPGNSVTGWLLDTLRHDPAQRTRFLTALGKFIGRLHHTGFVHGDLRSSNVLAEARAGRFHFALIDNERNRHSRPAPGKAVLKNLMQLNMLLPGDVSERDRWRFFRAWRQQMPQLTEVETKILAREAYGWAMKRLAAKGKL